MSRGRELTDFEQGEIIGLHKGKFSIRDIGKILNHPKSTVGNIIKKYNEQGSTSTELRSGRSKILSECNKRKLINLTKENRNKTLEEIIENFNTAIDITISSRTVQRTLHEEGYSGHAAKKKPFISEKN